MIKLIVEFECLHAPPEKAGEEPSMLMKRYGMGDIDTCPWPADYKDPVLANRLASALYDERECNSAMPSRESVVLLPDGTEFNFDEMLAAYPSTDNSGEY